VSTTDRWPDRVRRVLVAAGNLPIAGSVALRHLAWDPTHAQVLALRALPPALRRAAERAGSSGPLAGTVLTPLALAAQGRRSEAVRRLALAVEGTAVEGTAAEGTAAGARRRLRRSVAAACALDDADLAGRLLDRLPSTDPARHRLAALVAVRRGDLRRAGHEAGLAGRRGRRLAKRVRAEIATLSPPAGTAPDHRPPDHRPAGSRAPRPRLRPRPAEAPAAARRPGVDVLHLVTNALPEVQAGYTVRTQGIAVAQRRAGRDAQVATRLGFPVSVGVLGARAEAEVEGVPYHRLLPARPLPAAADARLRADVAATGALVDRLRPRVLHAHSNHLNAQVALAVGRPRGIPVVYEVRGFLEETWRSRGGSAGSDVYRMSRDAETWCMRQADAVVTLSRSMRDDLLGRGLPADHVQVVPNAVDDAYLVEPGDPAATRAELAIDRSAVVVGVISTLNDYEGIDTLVDAAARLLADGAPVHLLVVGDGPARHALAERAGAAGLGRRATFTGRVPRELAQRCHLATDVFCVPRLDTPVTRLVPPLKPLEAMASGRPVVASDLAPLRETIQHGTTGLLAPPGDPAALAGALRPLLYDSAGRSRMGRAARSWVLEHRTWRQAAQWYDTLYERHDRQAQGQSPQVFGQ
jgi:glycosyltransferase involved in cell wall biosynthesis